MRTPGPPGAGWTRRGMTFVTGTDEATELTDRQIHEQLKMYVAALRIADDFGCDAWASSTSKV